MAKIDTQELFQIAEDLAEERQQTLEKQKANREVLRNLQTMGVLSDKEEALLDDYYPIRTRERGGEEVAE